MDTKIKVCGLTRREDVELALELGADQLGFIVYAKSPRAVNEAQLADLLELVPPGKRVMVDVATATDELENYLHYQFDHYQLHFDLEISMATVAAWSGIVGQHALWLAPRIPPKERDFPQILMEFADTMLLDAFDRNAYGGTGKAGTNWQRFLDCTVFYQHKKWILAGGLSPDNIVDALRFTQAGHVDVNSGIESAPGIKDHARMRAFFAAVKNA
jgi:phosphoribosylanthranilate isomerase